MPPKRKGAIEQVVVSNADDMLIQTFRLHCQKRHAQTMRFRSRGEHEADHRLHQDRLDHTHKKGANDELAGAEQPDQGSDQ